MAAAGLCETKRLAFLQEPTKIVAELAKFLFSAPSVEEKCLQSQLNCHAKEMAQNMHGIGIPVVNSIRCGSVHSRAIDQCTRSQQCVPTHFIQR
jgi:hypothetical protein